MKEIISKVPIFETYAGMKKIDEVFIPIINDYYDFSIMNIKYDNVSQIEKEKLEKENKNKIYKEFYDLFSYISYESKHIVKYEHVANWSKVLWSDFEIKISINKLIEFISKHDTINNLHLLKSNSKEIFIKKVIDFILKMNDYDFIFSQNKILINKNGKFVPKKKIYNFNLSEEFFDMLSIINFDYNKKMLHPSINYLYYSKNVEFDQFNTKKAIQKIKDKINEDNSIQFMMYIVEKDRILEKILNKNRIYIFRLTY